MTLLLLLTLIALGTTLAHAMGKVGAWLPLTFIVIVLLIQVWR